MELALADCYDYLSTLAPASVDLLLTDPPYGTMSIGWDRAVDFRRFFAAVQRVLKPHAPMLLFCQFRTGLDIVVAAPRLFRYELVWEKSLAGGSLDAGRRPLRAHEFIFVLCDRMPSYQPVRLVTQKKAPYKNSPSRKHSSLYAPAKGDHCSASTDGSRMPRDVVFFPSERSFHPTSKPVALMRWLIECYSQPGSLVLDPFFWQRNVCDCL